MTKLLSVLAAAAACLGAGVGVAAGQDPKVPEQEWLPRVVPPGLTAPPPSAIPPIAIIETGIDPEHPEFASGWARVRRGSPVPPPGAARAVARYREGIAHGTAVAAVIGAPRDGVGIEGVLPGARVWVYGSDDSCEGTARAIIRAVDDGARVINMSYGFDPRSACLAHQDATSYAFGNNAVIVAAAGNDGNANARSQPANDLHMLTVVALNAFDQPTGFSNQNLFADIGAPGEAVLTALPVWADTEDGNPDGYARLDGTSFSAPIVAPAAAWLLAVRPDLTAHQAAEVLRGSARDLLRPGWDAATGYGVLDLPAALARPEPPHDPLEPNDAIRWVDGRALFRADPPFLRATRRQVLSARLDVQKDPVDIFPVNVPPGEVLRISMVPRHIRADLYVWHPRARATGSGLVARSRRPGLRSELLTIVNNSSIRRPAWVEVRAARGGDLSGGYRLTLRRSRR